MARSPRLVACPSAGRRGHAPWARRAPLPALVTTAVCGLLATPCTVSAQQLRFPTSAEDYAEFYPTAYYDEGSLTDWSCGSHTYAGHQGSDFGGGSWSGMDEGRDIVAAAHGYVIDAHDGEFDRCSTGDCPGGGGWGNYVWLRHASGLATVYAHLAEGSVAVTVGQRLRCGELLGLMGSSGHSTGPHLHLDVRTVAEARIDPFAGPCGSQPESLWVEQGDYMDLPALSCDDSVPGCAPTELIGCGASVAGSNDGAGSTDAIAFWGCEDSLQTGPEMTYEFATDRDEPVTVRLGGLGADLDLFVLDGPACDTTGCMAFSSEGNTSDEGLSFDAVAGRHYLLVVDGWSDAVSDFTLTTECDGNLPVGAGGAGGAGAEGAGAPSGGGDPSGVGGTHPLPGIPASGEPGSCHCRTAPPARAPWPVGLGVALLIGGRRVSSRRRAGRRS